MSKRLDLITEEKEGTSHQATLVTGRINLIYYIHQEEIKKPKVWPKKGDHDGTRTRTRMGKRSDLCNKGQGSASHQAALALARCKGMSKRLDLRNKEQESTK